MLPKASCHRHEVYCTRYERINSDQRPLKEREEELHVLKQIDQLKDEFIGLVSHELRTPLTVILGALSTVITEGDRLSAKETKQLVSDAYEEAELLSDILANLLELARAQANRLQINEEPVNLREIIETTPVPA